MNNKSNKPMVQLLACSVLAEEIRWLQQNHQLPYTVEFIDSMYHMRPAQLEEELNKKLVQNATQEKLVLVFGDCHAHIDQQESTTVRRTRVMNCIELILGKERYRQLQREGAFFLLPEWTGRWRQIFSEELGLSSKNAQGLMQETHQKLMYLDTGLRPVPYQTLEDIGAFTGLPVETEAVSLYHLQRAVLEAVKGVTE